MRDWYNKSYFDAIKKGAQYKPKLYRVIKRIMAHSPETVLDVGCGHGFLVKRLVNASINAHGIDFANSAGEECTGRFWQGDATKELPYPADSFDVVVSMDFFEHLEEEDIDKVYKEMKRVGKHIIALISFKPEKTAEGKPQDTHLTVKPREWWEDKIPGVEII